MHQKSLIKMKKSCIHSESKRQFNLLINYVNVSCNGYWHLINDNYAIFKTHDNIKLKKWKYAEITTFGNEGYIININLNALKSKLTKLSNLKPFSERKENVKYFKLKEQGINVNRKLLTQKRNHKFSSPNTKCLDTHGNFVPMKR